jgi:hypothetical protein
VVVSAADSNDGRDFIAGVLLPARQLPGSSLDGVAVRSR